MSIYGHQIDLRRNFVRISSIHDIVIIVEFSILFHFIFKFYTRLPSFSRRIYIYTYKYIITSYPMGYSIPSCCIRLRAIHTYRRSNGSSNIFSLVVHRFHSSRIWPSRGKLRPGLPIPLCVYIYTYVCVYYTVDI